MIVLSRLINKIKDYFKEEVEFSIDADRYGIDKSNNVIYDSYELPKDYDCNKPTIILVDDNVTMMSILDDDLAYLDKEHSISIKDYNVLKFSTNMAGFLYEDFLNMENIQVSFAILDITLNGSRLCNGINVELDGVDLAISTWKRFPTANIVFYTGNTLNSHIKKIGDMRDKFKDFRFESIDKYVIHKTSKSMKDRRNFLVKFFKAM